MNGPLQLAVASVNSALQLLVSNPSLTRDNGIVWFGPQLVDGEPAVTLGVTAPANDAAREAVQARLADTLGIERRRLRVYWMEAGDDG
jgi:hypothetical protein